MTTFQKQRIAEMRFHGSSYEKIAEALNLSKNTVKSYCQRNSLGGRPKIHKNVKRPTHCKQCGQLLPRDSKAVQKLFCRDKCRFTWWNANRNNPSHLSVCAQCSTQFNTRGNKGRKYCSHPCYIAGRYGKGGAGQ